MCGEIYSQMNAVICNKQKRLNVGMEKKNGNWKKNHVMYIIVSF
jgi:hypothetical protein